MDLGQPQNGQNGEDQPKPNDVELPDAPVNPAAEVKPDELPKVINPPPQVQEVPQEPVPPQRVTVDPPKVAPTQPQQDKSKWSSFLSGLGLGLGLPVLLSVLLCMFHDESLNTFSNL